MRIRPTSSLLLLLAPTIIAAANVDIPSGPADVLSNEEILALNHAPRGAEPAATSKPYLGTEDAPVDGKDGKPHLGPFVDRSPDDIKGKEGAATTTAIKALPTSLENLKAEELAALPERNDGVMDDENRVAPKKGTTGTEGGISEKEKARKEKEGLGENKPQEPKQVPPLPHSEEEHMVQADGKKGAKSPVKKDRISGGSEDKDAVTGETAQGAAPDDDSSDYGESGHGLEKPKDLPERPYDIPYAEPRTVPDGLGPPINPGAGKDKWLVDTMPDTEGKTNLRPAKGQKSSASSSSTSAGGDDPHHETWHEWFHSFVLSFAMIIFSEIGDKTFLVAALMAMRHDRMLVFSAALAALIAMTVLSAVLGHAFPTLLPKTFTTFAAAILFFVFGAKSLREGLAMPKDAGVGEEMREVEAELEEKEHSMRRKSRAGADAYELESGRGRTLSYDQVNRPEPSPPLSRSPSPKKRGKERFSGLFNLCSLIFSPVWVQTFVMTFLGEWGDRSQIATIAMAAGQDYWWVTAGAIVGHACCTGVAVVGGRALAGKVSMRVVTIGGAVAFLVFGCIYLYECLTE